MARLAAAFASSHSVMLTCELEDWLTKFRDRDDRLPFYDKLGNPHHLWSRCWPRRRPTPPR